MEDKTLKLNTVFLCGIVLFCQQAVSDNYKLCSLQNEYCDQNSSKACCYKWPEDISNVASSFTKLYISPGIYELKENVIIKGVHDLFIIGNGTLFMCKNGSFAVSSSSFIHIVNVSFINCGIHSYEQFNHCTTPLKIGTAIFMHEVSSIVFTNVAFEDSNGYGIVALNVIGNSELRNITVHQTTVMHILKVK